VSFEREDCVGIGGVVYLEEADLGVASSREELFVGRYFEAVDLAVGAVEGAGDDSGWCLPETDFVVVGCRG